MAYDKRITDLAAIAAAAAAKNAEVAPQLLAADITFTLADAVEDGRIILGREAAAAEAPCIGCGRDIADKPYVIDDNGEIGCPACFDDARQDECWAHDRDVERVARAICKAAILVAYPDASPTVLATLVEHFSPKFMPEARAAIAALTASKPEAEKPSALAEREKIAALVEAPATLAYLVRYGPRCRECADHEGVCPLTGIGCGEREKAVKFVLDGLAYGVRGDFLSTEEGKP